MRKRDPMAFWRLPWLLRADLRRGKPANRPIPDWLGLWWAIDGRREYPAWSALTEPDKLDLFALLPDWPRYGPFGMTPALRYMLDRRADLQKAFDVSSARGLQLAIAWFFTHGLYEHGLMDVVDPATLTALDAMPPSLRLPDDAAKRQPALTWLMFFAWRFAYLQAPFDLRTGQGQAAYLQWFLFEGVPNLHLAPLVAPRWRTWLREPLALRGRPSVAVPRAAVLMWQRRRDLQQTFDLRKPQGRVSFARWAKDAWQVEPGLHWLAEPATVTRPRQEIPATSTQRPFGLNLIGFAFGELGIGEDVRMAVAACEAARIPFAVVNIHPGDHLRQADRALANHVAERKEGGNEAPYSINLFCLTGYDTARAYLERGLPLFAGRYNIGWWPWELPVWPRDWRIAFDLVDEVWAATEFTRAMYAAVSLAPTFRMPLPASVVRVKPMTRRKLGLPAKRFLFVYVFDVNSYLARKNPFAAVKAFRRAFAADDDLVGLVLKTMNSDPKNPVWRRFVRECAKDARITLLDKTMDRGEMLGLIQACDAYVSLHRSEGFGRTLAEAMLFGKPVVGTDFSGNVDFLTAKTGFPVKWKRRAVRPGEYPFVTAADGAWWAEPDIADAARQMRAAREAAKDKTFAARVKRFAGKQFSPRRIGKLMRERLEAVAGKMAENSEGGSEIRAVSKRKG